MVRRVGIWLLGLWFRWGGHRWSIASNDTACAYLLILALASDQREGEADKGLVTSQVLKHLFLHDADLAFCVGCNRVEPATRRVLIRILLTKVVDLAKWVEFGAGQLALSAHCTIQVGSNPVLSIRLQVFKLGLCLDGVARELDKPDAACLILALDGYHIADSVDVLRFESCNLVINDHRRVLFGGRVPSLRLFLLFLLLFFFLLFLFLFWCWVLVVFWCFLLISNFENAFFRVLACLEWAFVNRPRF